MLASLLAVSLSLGAALATTVPTCTSFPTSSCPPFLTDSHQTPASAPYGPTTSLARPAHQPTHRTGGTRRRPRPVTAKCSNTRRQPPMRSCPGKARSGSCHKRAVPASGHRPDSRAFPRSSLRSDTSSLSKPKFVWAATRHQASRACGRPSGPWEKASDPTLRPLGPSVENGISPSPAMALVPSTKPCIAVLTPMASAMSPWG